MAQVIADRRDIDFVLHEQFQVDDLSKHEIFTDFNKKTVDLITYLVPLYVKEGKAYLTVATGCTGGRHRSVAVTEALRERLSERGITASVRHRDVNRT